MDSRPKPIVKLESLICCEIKGVGSGAKSMDVLNDLRRFSGIIIENIVNFDENFAKGRKEEEGQWEPQKHSKVVGFNRFNGLK